MNGRRQMMRWAGGLAALLAVTALTIGRTGSPAQAQGPVQLRIGTVGSPGSLMAVTADEYAKRVNGALKGRVEASVFPGSQLGTDEEMFKGVRAGKLEMFLPSTMLSTIEPKYGVFDLPYLIKDWTHMRRVAANPTIKRSLFDPLPSKGVRVLAFWENGFRHVTTSIRPVTRPDDLRGLKLRVPSGVWRLRMFKDWGAYPTVLPYAQTYAALQAGSVEAQENPFPQIWAGRFHEVQKYLSLTGHVYTPVFPMVGENWWQSLPAEVRNTLERIAVDTQEFAWREGERMDKELLVKLNSTLKVNEVDKGAFLQASRPIYDEFTKEVAGGGELIKLFGGLL